jgi:tRNA A37 N6-isopentenylltransferase MiaA
MNENLESELFQALLLQLGQAGWMALGKIGSPPDGRIERRLEVARLTIDTLAALETRTRGNLAPAEQALLDRTLRELRLNYVDEVKKGESPAPPTSEPPAPAPPATP